MSIDDIKKMNTHLNTKKQQTPRFTEYPVGTKFDTHSRWKEKEMQPKRTWSHKNVIPNMKTAWGKTKYYGDKAATGFSRVGDSLAKTFPGIANGSFDRDVLGFESPYTKRRKRK
jgi:hypothetical protein